MNERRATKTPAQSRGYSVGPEIAGRDRLKILYLSPNMAHYRSASYQADVAEEFAAQHDVFFYGPGYDDYAATDSIDDLLAKAPWGTPDVVCVGHAWLSDGRRGEIAPFGSIRLTELRLPKVIILNKEYTRLGDKLAYISEQKFGLVLTHHHAVDRYRAATGAKVVFWPFAADHNKFFPGNLHRDVDLFFSGTLKNTSHPEAHNDLRSQVQSKLYFAIGELKLFRRRKHGGRNVMWNAYSGHKWITRLDSALGRYRRIPDGEYQTMFNRSKVCFCTLSPFELVGCRYFEAMATGCLVLCQRSNRYEGIFEDQQHCLMFREDLSDFDRQLDRALNEDEWRQSVTSRASAHVRAHHTWARRIEQFTAHVSAL